MICMIKFGPCHDLHDWIFYAQVTDRYSNFGFRHDLLYFNPVMTDEQGIVISSKFDNVYSVKIINANAIKSVFMYNKQHIQLLQIMANNVDTPCHWWPRLVAQHGHR